MLNKLAPSILRFASIGGVLALAGTFAIAASSDPPKLEREFRAAWVATVFNIDWPSKAGLKVREQQQELTDLLNAAKWMGLNAIILQVRPAADALYQSSFEPWSPYLTGEMGLYPGYDPLEFAIEEAHKRGLELHAWFNPFRAQTNYKNAIADDHIVNTRKDWIKRYGNYLWLDPGNPEAREYSIQVILDVVERYDIDGVHLDDYFYPYPSNDDRLPFPDEDTFERFGRGKIEDWRRASIDDFIENLNKRIHKTKPWVLLGISPFGIWKPGTPKGTEAGLDAYSLLYADSRKWLRKGWTDYMMPQLYWMIDSKGQSFPKLLDWWVGENKRKRHLWPGIATDRVGPDRPASEMSKQIKLIRSSKQDYPGHAHWSADSLIKDQRGVQKHLIKTTYNYPALVPPSKWLKGSRPDAPTIAITPKGEQYVIKIAPQDAVRFWIVQTKIGSRWTFRRIDANQESVTVDSADIFAVSALGLTGLQSKPTVYDAR